MSGPLFDRFEIKIFCKPEIEKTENVKGRQILQSVRGALEFKKKVGAVTWPEISCQRLEQLSVGRGFRHQQNVTRIAETMALISSRREVEPCDVLAAVQLQKMEGLESHC